MTVKMDKYLLLLDRLGSCASALIITDAKGVVIASRGELLPTVARHHNQPLPTTPVVSVVRDSDTVTNAHNLATFNRSIFTSTGSLICTLQAQFHAESESVNQLNQKKLATAIDDLEPFVVMEFELNSELDAMATELVDRYEELNFVYDDNVESLDDVDENELVKRVLDSSIDYLNVQLVALSSPEQERIQLIASPESEFTDPYLVAQEITRCLYPVILQHKSCIIINQISDLERLRLLMDVPCKILACPVFDAQGAVDSILLCLNPVFSADFFNSDKSIIKLMARRIGKYQAINRDTLTGLSGRQAFDKILLKTINQTIQDHVSHVYLNVDIDRLGVINESLDHTAGDEVIKTIATRLKDTLRTTDSIGYLGEGRFGILLRMCTGTKGKSVAENLCRVVTETPFVHAQESLNLSITVGVTPVTPDVASLEAIQEFAEIARDSAKQAGRGSVKMFLRDDHELAERKDQMRWVSRIQRAIRDDKFLIYCQEIQPVQTCDEQYHFEILIRMCGEEGELITPFHFIPVAERHNLMPQLDRWVIDHTLALLSVNNLAKQPGEGVVSINLSGQTLADKDLVSYICERVKNHGLHPNCLCFEITETAAIGNMQSAHAVINQLKTAGYQFSLDDFGTGLSSFSYLRELPVDYLKIDGSFVRQIIEDPIAHAMVTSINQVGHVMGLRTIAEFVENSEISLQLQLIGVDYLQGYVIQKPIPVQEYLTQKGLSRGDPKLLEVG